VSRAASGDQDAIHFLYVRFGPEVRAQVEAVVGDEDLAHELTDDLFAGLDRLIARDRTHEGRFDAWLAELARTTAVAYLRSREQAPARLNVHSSACPGRH
jgi:DNA-directed RNA polymerase specialized sigma24 family protein